jgi:protein ImuA
MQTDPEAPSGPPTPGAIADLPATSCGAVSVRASAKWKPGQGGVHHSEVFASGRDSSGAAAALALAMDMLASTEPGPLAETTDQRAILWVQDRASVRLTGRPYRPGLPADLCHRIIHVVAEKAEDVLFALEEGVRCRDLACVIGEVVGNPKALNFTASRRLSLAAERYGVQLWLVRLDAGRDLSSARMRWDVRAAPSSIPRWNADAPGLPAWHAELFRSRTHPPGEWILRRDPTGLSAQKPTDIAHDITAPTTGPTIANENDIKPAPNPVDLARPTVGRSMAAL